MFSLDTTGRGRKRGLQKNVEMLKKKKKKKKKNMKSGKMVLLPETQSGVKRGKMKNLWLYFQIKTIYVPQQSSTIGPDWSEIWMYWFFIFPWMMQAGVDFRWWRRKVPLNIERTFILKNCCQRAFLRYIDFLNPHLAHLDFCVSFS